MKSVRIRSYSGLHFPAFKYSDRMWEYTDQNNSEYGHFLSNVKISFTALNLVDSFLKAIHY